MWKKSAFFNETESFFADAEKWKKICFLLLTSFFGHAILPQSTLWEPAGVYGKMQTNSAENGNVLNLREAAAFIRVSEKTMREMARKNHVPCRKVGREWRFLQKSLEEWLAGKGQDFVAEPVVQYHQKSLFPEEAPEKKFKSSFGDTAFTKNQRDPIHRWVPWIAGFSASFVEEVLEAAIEDKYERTTVLDPFSGVGTTLVEGLKFGCDVIGFEINPYAALACEIKLGAATSSLKKLSTIIRKLEELRNHSFLNSSQPESTPPAKFRSKTRFFSPSIEKQVLVLLDFIKEQKDPFIGKLLRLALGTVMVGFSNYSYEPSLSTRKSAGKDNIEHADVLKNFCEKLWEMEADMGFLQQHLNRYEPAPTSKIIKCSYLKGYEALAPQSVDVLITSPPYLNNYHYVRNTRPHMYWLELVDDNQELKQLEKESFGQFWQTVRSGPSVELDFEHHELNEILNTIRERNTEKGVYGGAGWANYAATYFNDCYRFFEASRYVMKPGGWVVVVIGNNIVQGVHIETERFLAEIGELFGFETVGMHLVRRKRTGSSLVNSSIRAGFTKKPTELYEVAVEMRAPK